jgi:ABC-type multidrug transport system ATPase subunit
MCLPGDALFTADSLGVSFRDRVILKAASVWARMGSITVLLGRNGCGKTTLIRAALGLGPRDFGFVRFAGRTWERPHLPALARLGLFYLPDRGLLSWRRSVNWHLKALEQSLVEPIDLGRAGALGIESLGRRTARALSGGERRRVELALALLRRPDCLIADEPLAELSPADRRKVAIALRQLADGGCAVIATGHEIDDLLELGDVIVWMSAGTTHWLGTADEARSHSQFRLEYLGSRAARKQSGGSTAI